MPFFNKSRRTVVIDSHLYDQTINYTTTIFDMLKGHTANNAHYNSSERELQQASACLEGTRTEVISQISTWATGPDSRPICWLEGPAGSGKSSVAHTIAEQCDNDKRLAVSFFFSRGKPDRDSTAKFFPTFAYQLASFVEAVQTPMRDVLSKKPLLPSSRLEVQLKELILDPMLSIVHPVTPMIAVVDGLDECSDDDLVRGLIQLLADATDQLPFRFLFASRPEKHIRTMFDSPSIQNKTLHLTLRDFDARDDVCKYLRVHLSKVHEENSEAMCNISKPWPPAKDLEVLVDQSEGLFIYVSTLVKFVGDGNGLPQQKLQKVMEVHKGVDPLYDQVLSNARRCSHFQEVMGAIMFIREPLTINTIEQLLHLESGTVRVALSRCISILVIPSVDDDGCPLPYHASLREFLTDSTRTQRHFLSPLQYHTALLINCLKLIQVQLEHNVEDDKHLIYACQNWCYHLLSILSHGGTLDKLDACLESSMKDIMVTMQQKWLKLWMYKLRNEKHLSVVCGDLQNVIDKIADSPEWKSARKTLKQTQGTVDNLNKRVTDLDLWL